MVLCRQLINAIITDGRPRPPGKDHDKVRIVTFGNKRTTHQGTIEQWTTLRTDANVADVTTVKHFGANYSPKAAGHEWLYYIHPREMKMLGYWAKKAGLSDWKVDATEYE